MYQVSQLDARNRVEEVQEAFVVRAIASGTNVGVEMAIARPTSGDPARAPV
jgi:hypothetical protein